MKMLSDAIFPFMSKRTSSIRSKEKNDRNRKDNYFPIFIDRKKSTRISVQVSGGDSAFTADMFDEIRLIAPKTGCCIHTTRKKRLIKEQDGYTIKEYLDYDEKNHCHRIKETNIYGEEKMTQYAFDSFERLTYTEDSKGNVEEYDYDEKGTASKQGLPTKRRLVDEG